MTYRKTYSPKLYGVFRIFLGIFAAIFTYGSFYFANTSIDRFNEAIYGNHGLLFQLFFIVFWILWLGFGTAFTYWSFSAGFKSLKSKKKWVIEINDSTFIRQTPHKSIGKDFSIPLKDINKIIKKGESAEYIEWLLQCANGEVIDISDNSPFNTEKIVQILLSANPEIEYAKK